MAARVCYPVRPFSFQTESGEAGLAVSSKKGTRQPLGWASLACCSEVAADQIQASKYSPSAGFSAAIFVSVST